MYINSKDGKSRETQNKTYKKLELTHEWQSYHFRFALYNSPYIYHANDTNNMRIVTFLSKKYQKY